MIGAVGRDVLPSPRPPPSVAEPLRAGSLGEPVGGRARVPVVAAAAAAVAAVVPALLLTFPRRWRFEARGRPVSPLYAAVVA